MESLPLNLVSKRISKFTALLTVLIGFLVLIAWFLNIDLITALLPNLINMKANTALGFILSGISVWLLNQKNFLHNLAYLFASLVLILSACTLIQYVPQSNIGIHKLKQEIDAISILSTDHMSMLAAFNFFLIGFILLTSNLKSFCIANQIFIGIVLLVSFLSALGYLFGANIYLGLLNFTKMSILASITFIILSISILFLQHEIGIIKFLSKPLAGSKMALRLLPVLIFVPIIIGLFRLWGEKAGLYNTEYGTAIFTASIVLIFIALVCLLAWLINKSEQANEKLTSDIQASYIYMRTIFENIDEGIISINDSSRIESINTKGLNIFGYDLDEILQKDLTMLMPEEFRPLHEAGIKRYQETGIAHVIGKGGIELKGLRKDGTIFPLELSVTESSIKNRRIFTGVLRDITERKKIETYQSQLTSIVESSSDAIFSKNLDGTVLSWNPAAENLYGFSAAEIINQSILTIVPDEKQIEVQNILQKVKKGERIPYFETVRKHKDGHLIQVGVAISPIRDQEGNVIAASVICSDITERKKIDKLKNEFVSLVSHELRTPLTSIQGSLSLLVGGVAGELPEKAQQLLTIGKQNSERLIRLINDLLDIEKIESGKTEFHLQPTSIKKIVNESVKSNQAYAEKFNMTIYLKDDYDALVNVDKDRLLQVLANLLSNAIKFSSGSEVVIAINKSDLYVRVSVTNKGPGIPKDFQKRIFQKFAQADSTSSRTVPGTGLGLNISKEIIEKLNGKIGFASEPNKETTFYFELPIVEEAREITKTYEKRPTILICEDDLDIANYLKLILDENKLHALISHSASEAKKMLAEHNVDALLLDLILPDQSGISLLKELREDYSFSALPIIVVSMIAQKGKQELNGNIFPVLDWIDKPIDLDRLIRSIQVLKKQIANVSPHILHVEDDSDLLEVLANLLQDKAYVDGVTTIKQAKLQLNQKKYDLVILDLMLPDGSGTDLLPLISKTKTPIIVFSAYELPKNYAQYVVQNLLKSQIAPNDVVQIIKSAIKKKEKTTENLVVAQSKNQGDLL